MPPKKKSKPSAAGGAKNKRAVSKKKSIPKGKRVQQKNPAEFFAENQNIAGFDNPGKALYTTIRELVENSLDAAESIQVLPSIQLEVRELSQKTFDVLRGSEKRARQNLSLYEKDIQSEIPNDSAAAVAAAPTSIEKHEISNAGSKRKRSESEDSSVSVMSQSQNGDLNTSIESTQDNFVAPMSQDIDLSQSQSTTTKAAAIKNKNSKKKSKRKSSTRVGFYKIVCRDNGMGMETKKVSEFLGRVLSGSKYGVKQTRGKFGLGAKMALIWSKKSTGLPIEIRTAHGIDGGKEPGPEISQTKLDINIYKNEPKIISQEISENSEKWRGTEFTVVLEGNWQWAKSKIQKYMSALAVVTPFADFTLSYDSDMGSKPFTLRYERRSERIPPPAKTIKHHPRSVNQLIVQKLLHNFDQRKQLWVFLKSEFQCISPPLAKKLVAELNLDKAMKVQEVTNNTQLVHNITKILKEAKFSSPSGKCLSPAGEYNLKLGIIKEYVPDHVATGRTKVCVFEGHPFIVEAGVSIGGKEQKEGIHVYRFANRIPLLFEAHSDVVTQVAKNSITWSNYHIKKNVDKIGVFVSIVSTKIPFKGTGKEFISSANKEYYDAVTKAIRNCCNQLKQTLKSRKTNRAKEQRLKNMERFIPSVCKSIVNVLNSIIERQEIGDVAKDDSAKTKRKKTKSLDDNALKLKPNVLKLLKDVKSKKVTKQVLEKKLKESVELFDEGELAMVVEKGQILEEDRVNCFLLPLNTTDASNFAFDMQRTALNRPNVVFRVLRGLLQKEEQNVRPPILGNTPSSSLADNGDIMQFGDGVNGNDKNNNNNNDNTINMEETFVEDDLELKSDEDEILENSGNENDDVVLEEAKTYTSSSRRGSSRKAALTAKQKIKKVMESSEEEEDENDSSNVDSDNDVVDLT
jgi:DNA topoisomerase VI subunit B